MNIRTINELGDIRGKFIYYEMILMFKLKMEKL